MIGLKLNVNNLSSEEKIFYLRLFYTKLFYMLNTFGESKFFALDQEFNYCYRILTIEIEKLLKLKDFSELYDEKPELTETLLTGRDHLDLGWEITGADVGRFLGKIENLYIDSGAPVIEIPEEIASFISYFDYVLNKFEERSRNITENVLKGIDEQNKQYENIPKKNNVTIPANNRAGSAKEKNKKTVIDLPEGANWDDITIEFLNDYDIRIRYKDKLYGKFSYDELEFADKRSDKAKETTRAKESWKFLLILSVSKEAIPLNNLNKEERSQRTKTKQDLSNRLKKLFQINEDPFFGYKEFQGYKIKIKLISGGDLKEEDYYDKKRNIYDPGEDKFSDLEDSYKEQTEQF